MVIQILFKNAARGQDGSLPDSHYLIEEQAIKDVRAIIEPHLKGENIDSVAPLANRSIFCRADRVDILASAIKNAGFSCTHAVYRELPNGLGKIEIHFSTDTYKPKLSAFS